MRFHLTIEVTNTFEEDPAAQIAWLLKHVDGLADAGALYECDGSYAGCYTFTEDDENGPCPTCGEVGDFYGEAS